MLPEDEEETLELAVITKEMFVEYVKRVLDAAPIDYVMIDSLIFGSYRTLTDEDGKLVGGFADIWGMGFSKNHMTEAALEIAEDMGIENFAIDFSIEIPDEETDLLRNQMRGVKNGEGHTHLVEGIEDNVVGIELPDDY